MISDLSIKPHKMSLNKKHLYGLFAFVCSVLVIRASVVLIVFNLSYLTLKLTGSEEVAQIFMQLKTAVIQPPWLIPVLFSIIIGYIINKLKPFPAALSILFILFTAILFSLYFTSVNQIQIRHVIKILFSLNKNGVLSEIF